MAVDVGSFEARQSVLTSLGFGSAGADYLTARSSPGSQVVSAGACHRVPLGPYGPIACHSG